MTSTASRWQVLFSWFLKLMVASFQFKKVLPVAMELLYNLNTAVWSAGSDYPLNKLH